MAGIVVAHARLELALTELVYELLRIDPKLGRQVLRGDAANANFETAERLLDLWSIAVPQGLKKRIRQACDKRNEVAHGVWVRVKKNDVRLQLVRGKRVTEVGQLERRILSQFAKRTLKKLGEDARFIHGVTAQVRALQKQVGQELADWKKIMPHKRPRR